MIKFPDGLYMEEAHQLSLLQIQQFPSCYTYFFRDEVTVILANSPPFLYSEILHRCHTRDETFGERGPKVTLKQNLQGKCRKAAISHQVLQVCA